MSALGRLRLMVVVAFAASTAAVVPACVTPAQEHQDQFQRIAREFNDDVRWARYDSAAASFPVEDAKLFLERVKLAGKDLEIADQDVSAITFAGPEAAKVTVRFDWFNRRDMIVKSSTFEQLWKYEDGRWQMKGQRRTAGDRFPLVLEPSAPPAPAKPTPPPAAPAAQ